MAQGLMVDTNIVSNIVRRPEGQAALRLQDSLDRGVCTSIVVMAVLYFGAEKVQSAKLKRRIDNILGVIEVFDLSTGVADHYAEIRAHLERRGLPIGSNDLLIAAHARSLDLTLVTDNIGEFSRVPNLRVENWLD